MSKENEYILFLDETDTNSGNQYFCLAGFIISRQEYETVLIPQINDIKTNILKEPHIVFHYNAMKKQTEEFEILKSKELREIFWNSICDILKVANITVLAAYINAHEYRRNYSSDEALSDYNVLFNEIMNSYLHFLINNNGAGTIILESRDIKRDQQTQNLYSIMAQKGTNIYLPIAIKNRISTLNFNIKKDNCIGLQVADMIPLAFIRHLHRKSNSYNLYNVLNSKLYKGGQETTSGYGFINVLR